jgi:hypothetical protein
MRQLRVASWTNRDSLRLYGLAAARLAGSELGEVVELYFRREDAEQALRGVLGDEPTWSGELRVIPVQLPGLRCSLFHRPG